jgi:F-box and leucine-rich repeat protein GRR1
LNNCPKLTHLSLTGVQAFLRDELLAYCREAPPEFNEHQRDVFCVFSGTGVARLREFLNDQKRREEAAGPGSVTSSAMEDSDMVDVEIDDDQQSPDSDGSNTPVLNVDVHGQYPPGATPVVAGPSAIPFPPVPPMHHHHHHHHHGPSVLSQSAPATTGGVVWSGSTTPNVIVLGIGGTTTILDEDEEEGDETFGEGSDTMGD